MTYAKLITETAIDRNPPRRATIGGALVVGVLPADYLATLGYFPLDESAPETSRTNLTAYVVKTTTAGVVDTQWVWYNRQIDLAPNRYVVYETYDRATTNKAEWVDWTNAVTVVKNGRTWEGCHVCTVARPTWAQGGACLDLPNETFGGPLGFDFGDLLLTSGGEPLYTGFVTNGATGAVLYFDNGLCKGSPEE
jgi:hypothetical protein